MSTLPSETEPFVFLSDNMYKSLHDIVLFFLFLLQKEEKQFWVSLLIVHLMKVVTTVLACTECVKIFSLYTCQ